MKSMISAIATLFLTTVVYAAPLDKIQFIKISPQDSRAVIRTVGGRMQVVKPGDVIAENTTVKEIAPGRIILEENTASGLNTIIVHIDNGKTRIERLRKNAENVQPLVAPSTQQK